MKPEVGKAAIDYSELPPVPDGTYECIVVSYKQVDNPYYRSEPHENTTDKPVIRSGKTYLPGDVIPADPEWVATQYQFVFEIVEGPHKGRWLFKRTGTMLTSNERNHMYQLFSKIVDSDLLDAMINDGDAPDIDEDIVGKPVICIVSVVKTKKGTKASKVMGFLRSSRNPANDEVVSVSIDDLAEAVGEGEEIPF